MQKIILVIVILLPLGVGAQSVSKPAVDSRSAFEVVLAKLRSVQAEQLKSFASDSMSDPLLIRRLENANNILLNIKTRRSLIAFLLEPPDLFYGPDEPLRLQWVQILQNEAIADALEKKQPTASRSGVKNVILQ